MLVTKSLQQNRYSRFEENPREVNVLHSFQMQTKSTILKRLAAFSI